MEKPVPPTQATGPYAAQGAAAAADARQLQQAQDAQDAQARKAAQPGEDRPAPGPGHPEPATPLPRQHLKKPGIEADMELAPRFKAPHYRGSGKLAGFGAIVTGGDSGIGRAVAVLFAREGADVAVLYLSEHEDAEETRRCIEAEGQRCLLIPGDVKSSAFCRSAVDQVVAAFGRLDVLVNNAAFQLHARGAGRPQRRALGRDLPHQHLRLFPHGPGGAAAPAPGQQHHQHRLGHRPAGSSHLLDYSATKGAIHAFSMSLAKNLAPRGIRVNAVAPGPVWTPLNPADKPAEEIADFGKDTDLGRPAQPEEIAPAYVFLASPVCSSYITGTVLPITGSVG
jgi:Dehydrogenases with different specificities (related to short-chain alcohol dehydrogenases)